MSLRSTPLLALSLLLGCAIALGAGCGAAGDDDDSAPGDDDSSGDDDDAAGDDDDSAASGSACSDSERAYLNTPLASDNDPEDCEDTPDGSYLSSTTAGDCYAGCFTSDDVDSCMAECMAATSLPLQASCSACFSGFVGCVATNCILRSAQVNSACSDGCDQGCIDAHEALDECMADAPCDADLAACVGG